MATAILDPTIREFDSATPGLVHPITGLLAINCAWVTGTVNGSMQVNPPGATIDTDTAGTFVTFDPVTTSETWSISVAGTVEKVVLGNARLVFPDGKFTRIQPSAQARGAGFHELFDGSLARYAGVDTALKEEIAWTTRFASYETATKLKTLFQTIGDFFLIPDSILLHNIGYPAIFKDAALALNYANPNRSLGYTLNFVTSEV